MSHNHAQQRRYRDVRTYREARTAANTSLVRHAGDPVTLIGHPRALQAIRSQLERAIARHEAFWAIADLPASGMTVRQIRDMTGAGKGYVRRRLATLERRGEVETRHVGGECRWFPATAVERDAA